jgi:hypothetical protein
MLTRRDRGHSGRSISLKSEFDSNQCAVVRIDSDWSEAGQRTRFRESRSSPCSLLARQYEISPEMTSLPAKVIAIEERGYQYQVIVQISTKYRVSLNTLLFGEIKPYSGSLKDDRLDLIYYRDPGLACRPRS